MNDISRTTDLDALIAGAEPAPRPRRVMHVTEAPLGGVVSCIEELLRSQVERDVESITLVTPEINLGALGAIRSPRLRLVPFRHDRGSIGALARLARLTIREARRTRPDILHVHSTIAGLVVRACGPFLPSGTRIIYCPHSWAFTREGGKLKSRATALVERGLSLLADRIICVSAFEKRDAMAAGIAEDRLTVIENGISPRGPAPVPTERTGPLVIAFAGRFDRQKGFDTYVEVMRRLGDEARGLAIGRAIVTNAETPAPPATVELTGWQPRERVLELFAEADILLMPSRWEGFPMVALESMEAGLPVFASAVGGLRDIILDRETGRLFAPDDVAGIVQAIRETGREDLRRYRIRAEERYRRHYTAQRMNDRVWALYADVLRGARTTRAAGGFDKGLWTGAEEAR